MTKLRGHPIINVDGVWLHETTREPAANIVDWPCGHCGKPNTPEGHDGCLGTLPGVMNACCGHGVTEEAYTQYWDGSSIRGRAARREQRRLTMGDEK